MVPFDDYPLPERHGWRRLTDETYPIFSINSESLHPEGLELLLTSPERNGYKYKGYIDKKTFHDMRDGWFCNQCEFIDESFLKVISHNILHLLYIVKKKPDYSGVF